ncbi:MAG: ribbon-helix-helix protein, CopG family [Dehalococcoidia bacterium]|jgi:metal-responsive CopG/Arc/MetJ family transcriptional regulator
MAKSITVELDVELLEALQRKAASTSCSLSQLINMAIREFIVDEQYLVLAGEVNCEPLVSYSELLQERSIKLDS